MDMNANATLRSIKMEMFYLLFTLNSDGHVKQWNWKMYKAQLELRGNERFVGMKKKCNSNWNDYVLWTSEGWGRRRRVEERQRERERGRQAKKWNNPETSAELHFRLTESVDWWIEVGRIVYESFSSLYIITLSAQSVQQWTMQMNGLYLWICKFVGCCCWKLFRLLLCQNCYAVVGIAAFPSDVTKICLLPYNKQRKWAIICVLSLSLSPPLSISLSGSVLLCAYHVFV